MIAHSFASRDRGSLFATTEWSRVLRAAERESPEARLALSDLCQAYWYPLYAYHRRRGAAAEQAEDAVQGFFAWLLEKNALRYADPARGRFRGFLVSAFRQYLARQHEFETALKRNPGSAVVSIDALEGESRYAIEMADEVTPERIFEYAWAVEVIRRAMERLRQEQIGPVRSARFAAFEGVLTGQAEVTAAELGQTLGISEGTVRVALHRLRQRYGDILREEVAATIDEGEDVEEELRAMREALNVGRSL